MKREYLHNLTALRGLAALFVVIHHFDFFMGQICPQNTTGIIYKFYLMVDLFFILSGFVICYVYQDSFQLSISKQNYRQFFYARLARVYPLHIITLLAEIVLYLVVVAYDKVELLANWQQHLYRWDAIPVQLTFLQTIGIFNFDTWNAPAWSLSAEWWAYILFPFVFVLLLKTRKLYGIIVASIIVVTGWLLIEFKLAPLEPFMNFPANPNNITLGVNWHYGTLRGITGFIAGMIIWHLYRRNIFRQVLANSWFLAMLFLISIICTHYKMIDTVTVLLFAFIILSSAYGSNSMNRFFSWKPFQKLGQWSFSIYIWHMVIFNVITTWFIFQRTEQVKGILRPFNKSPFDPIFVMFVVLPIILLIGWLSYTFIEKPLRKRLKKKLIHL